MCYPTYNYFYKQIAPLRTKQETLLALDSQVTEAYRVGGNAAFKHLKTRHGVKDTFLQEFLDRLFAISTKRGKTKRDKEESMAQVRRAFPKNIMSPVWRIKGKLYHYIIITTTISMNLVRFQSSLRHACRNSSRYFIRICKVFLA